MSHYYLNNLPHGTRKNGEKLDTGLHAAYIMRLGDYERIHGRDEDFLYRSSGNIPEWAETALDFWNEAEAHRSKNGRAYREFKVGLQEELSLEDNIACIEELLEKTGIKDRHVYSYAVHDKEARFDKDHRNIHAHIMFDERILEKDRPLGPDTFFNRASTRRDGTPIGGYLKSRAFSKDNENATKDLRKLWADIVNAKFKERGLDISVSEKTLKDQREELLAQGREEEAALLDRTPAPHLGDKAKNPKVCEHIRSMIETISNEDPDNDTSDSSIPTPKEVAENANETELDYIIFAHDAAVRRLAREIQKERKALLEKRKEEVKKAVAEEEATANRVAYENEAIVVTVGDVINGFEDKMVAALDFYKKQWEQQTLLEASIMDQKTMHTHIHNVMSKGEWEKERKALRALNKEYASLKSIESRTDKYNTPMAYKKALDYRADVLQKRRQSAKQLLAIRRYLREGGRFEKEAIAKQITDTNQQAIKASEMLRRKAEKASRAYRFYYKKASELFETPPDTVLFAEALPQEVRLSDKLYGQIPLYKLPKVARIIPSEVRQMEQFVVIADHKETQDQGSTKPIKESGERTVEAVKINSTVTQGQADVYAVTLMPKKTADGRDYYTIKEVAPTKKRVRLYEYTPRNTSAKQLRKNIVNKLKEKTPRAVKPHPIRTSSSVLPMHKKGNIIGKIVNDMMKPTAAGRNQNLWYDNDHDREEEQSEMQKTEERIKRGWSL